jgi:copper chaperone CopZ
VRSVEKKLSGVAGVESAHVDLAAAKATVEYDSARTSPETLVAAVEQIGFQATQP